MGVRTARTMVLDRVEHQEDVIPTKRRAVRERKTDEMPGRFFSSELQDDLLFEEEEFEEEQDEDENAGST